MEESMGTCTATTRMFDSDQPMRLTVLYGAGNGSSTIEEDAVEVLSDRKVSSVQTRTMNGRADSDLGR